MPYKPLGFFGSFQEGNLHRSENPLEEVWARVARFGIDSWVQSLERSGAQPVSARWEEYGPYAVIRVRQAVEFREASRNLSILTRPLPLYYSFLNLTRGFHALESQRIPAPGHGLRFARRDDLMSATAKIEKGTFSDYLQETLKSFTIGAEVSLNDVLSRIVETASDYTSLRQGRSKVIPVTVDASEENIVRFVCHFPRNEVESVRDSWQRLLPSFVDVCDLEAEGAVLRVKRGVDISSYEAISRLCRERLEMNLWWSEEATWYAIVRTDPDITFPRSGYYFIALFILGSIVRYEPELLLRSAPPDSELGWVLGRFLRAAERFYPQLMLNWIYSKPVFF